MNFSQADRDLINTEVQENLCAAIRHLGIAVIRAADSPDYSVYEKDRILDAIEVIAAISRDCIYVDLATNN